MTRARYETVEHDGAWVYRLGHCECLRKRPSEERGRRLQTVTSIDLLAEVNTGCPLLLAEMTLLTALRTAATSARPLRQPATGGIGRDA